MKKIVIVVTLCALVIPFHFVSAAFCPPQFCPGPGRNPIIIVPGILGSWNWDVFLNDNDNGAWEFTPFTNFYQPLVNALKEQGYTEGKDLFIAFYDWRLPNTVAAQRYLKPVIEQAKQTSGRPQVDIIAHSMGGILARAYIQGGHYDLDVRNLFLLGTPNYGSSDIYTTWEGGHIPGNWSNIQKVFLKIYLFYRGTEKLALTLGDKARYDTIHNEILSLQDLLPTYDYVKDIPSNTLKSTASLTEQNLALNSFNAEIDSLPFLVASITDIAGNNQPTVAEIPVNNRSGGEDPLWVDGKPEPIDPARNTNDGDGSVVLSSALIPNLADQIILDNVGHVDLPSMAAKDIFTRLGFSWPYAEEHLALVDQPRNILSFSFASPVAPTVADQYGHEISAATNTFPSGEAIYFGEDDPNGKKTILISDPADGQYDINMSGTAAGHYEMLSMYAQQNNPAVEQVFSGEVSQGQEIFFTADLDAQASQPFETKPADADPPLIEIISPSARDYQRSEQIPVNVAINDPSGISWSRNLLDGNMTTLNTLDLFYQKLGQHNFTASAADSLNNATSSEVNFQIIATPDSTISDIHRAYSLGWISSEKAESGLIKFFQKAIKAREVITYLDAKHKAKRKKVEKVIDKAILRTALAHLSLTRKRGQIDSQAYLLLKEDCEWLLSH